MKSTHFNPIVRSKAGLAVTLLVCLSLTGATVWGRARLFSPPGTEKFSPDTHGLEKQFQPFLDAYTSRDTSSLDKKFSIFVLPNSHDWFSKYFAKDNVEQLANDHEAEVPVFEKSLITILNFWPKGTHFRVHAKNHKNESTNRLQPKSDAVNPTSPVPLEQFDVTFTPDRVSSSGMGNFSVLVNVVYVDGAYRFMGKGSYPFWSMPDATSKKDIGKPAQ